MALTNMNLIGVHIFVTKLWPVQALACGGGGDGGDGGDGGATKNIISPKFSNFGDIITIFMWLQFCWIYMYLLLLSIYIYMSIWNCILTMSTIQIMYMGSH